MYYLEKDRAAGMLIGESREGPRALTGFDLVLKPALLHMKEGTEKKGRGHNIHNVKTCRG